MTKILFKVTIAVISFTFTGVAAQGQTSGDIPTTLQDSSQTEISQIKNKLIGSWVLEKAPSNKITFTSDNKLKSYHDGVLKWTDSFMIGSSCDEETLSSGYFLITTSSEGIKSCDYIDHLSDTDGRGRLVLITRNQGKIIIYKRD